MQRCWRSAILAGLALGLTAVPVGAARAAAVPFTATLTLEFVGVATFVMPGSGTLTLNGSSAASASLVSLAVPGFAISSTATAALTPARFPAAGIQVTARNGVGAFGGAPIGGVMPLFGVAKVCFYAACNGYDNISNLSIPLTIIGQGGSVMIPGEIAATVVGAPWTSATASIGTLTRMGVRESAGGGSTSTAAQGGRLQLVTPAAFAANYPGAGFIPIFGTLDIHFVPEPGTIALLGGGIAALAFAGLRRR